MANTLNLGNGNWGVKKDSLLGYNSENGNFKPLAFNFTRASSATVVNKAGLIETVGSGKPRIDFSNDAKGALLLEPTRNNLITNSEKFVDAPIGNTNMDLFSGAITNNDTTSPNGNVTAMKFTIGGTSSSLLRIYQSDLSTSSDNTFSIYAKKGTANSLSIDITDVTVVNSILTDEWQRISVTNISTSSKFIDVEVLGNVGEYIYIFGLQLEQSSYATSYIPTQGSFVTRSADSSSQTVPSGIIGQTEGVLYIDFVHEDSIPSDRWYVNLNDGGSNYIAIGHYSTVLYMRMFNGGEQAPINYNIPLVIGKRYKVAVSYALNNVSFYVDGVLFETDTNATIPSTSIVSLQRGSFISKAKVNEVKLYNTRLSNAELQALTTI